LRVTPRSPGAIADYGLDSDEACRIEAGFVVYEHVDTERGPDFELELWRSRSLLPHFVTDLLRYLAVDKRTDITAETHGMGYHMHFIKRGERTDVLLLFDPTEPNIEMPVLYWERHAEGHCVAVRPPPDHFGLTMRKKIYKTSRVLL